MKKTIKKEKIMKKLYCALIALITTWSLIPAPMTLNEVNQMIVSYHNNAFGVDHLFDKKINDAHLAAWLQAGSEVDTYVMSHCQDIFGTQDPTLIKALQTIDKANKTLVNTIKNTYKARSNTASLIKMAVIFTAIEKQMKSVIETLTQSTFILKRKKNAKALLLNFALFIQITAQKANKDTRMGHRTDITIPTTPKINLPKKTTTPLHPPADLPPVYEETPEFAPPTRIPALPSKTAN